MAAAMVLGTLTACAPVTEESVSLAGTSWTVTALEGQAPLDGRGGAPTLVFNAEGGVAGSTGCNRYSGGAEEGADWSLAIGGEEGALVTTKMACTPLLMAQETRMTAALVRVARYEIAADGRLRLTDDAGAAVLEATPAEAE
jgi:heat shock protein HslJ